jgi:hypothetical protein
VYNITYFSRRPAQPPQRTQLAQRTRFTAFFLPPVFFGRNGFFLFFFGGISFPLHY